jgi:hypothetical protein
MLQFLTQLLRPARIDPLSPRRSAVPLRTAGARDLMANDVLAFVVRPAQYLHGDDVANTVGVTRCTARRGATGQERPLHAHDHQRSKSGVRRQQRVTSWPISAAVTIRW